MRNERDKTTFMVSKDFNSSPHKWVTDLSGLQDKDSGALFLLTALSRSRSRVYKHKSHKLCFQVTVTISTNQNLEIRDFLVCSFYCQSIYNASLSVQPIRFICSFCGSEYYVSRELRMHNDYCYGLGGGGSAIGS